MQPEKIDLKVQEGESERLDLFLVGKLPELSRSSVQGLIRSAAVLVNGKVSKSHHRVREGDRISVEIVEKEVSRSRPEEIPLRIFHEDDDVLVLDKPAGLVVHPAAGNEEHTLVNALLYHTQNRLSSLGGPGRPGIVHRLDKDTSGVMVVAKNDKAHRSLSSQFRKHTILKLYEAFVKGIVQHDEMKCEEPVEHSYVNRRKVMVRPSGGKAACTYFRVLERFHNATHLEARPVTGRTHQIRVHLAFLGYPILGDPLYGGETPLICRHALHARVLEFDHPVQKKRMRFVSELHQDLLELAVALRG